MKKDGHTHTEYCLHGSREKTEDFIIAAIGKGFDVYTITEHLPVPKEFHKKTSYTPEIMSNKLCITENEIDLDQYIKDMQGLKAKYQDKIQLLIGFEVDYLADHGDWTKKLFKEYGKYLDEVVVSVHFIWGKGGWRCPAYNQDDFRENILGYYKTFENVQLEYLRFVKEAVGFNFGFDKPKRIGHMTYCSKFQKQFQENQGTTPKMEETVLDVLQTIKQKGYGIDVNVSGLFHEYYGDTYPSAWIIEQGRKMNIPLTYGSDSHYVKNVGRGYETYQRLMTQLS